jgi:spoIIIJ-associated protein
MTFREFTGKNVEEAIRAAMAEFNAELGELDIEILAQGSRGILGVGGEQARILAAPKSAVAAAETVRVPAAESAAPPKTEPATEERLAEEASPAVAEVPAGEEVPAATATSPEAMAAPERIPRRRPAEGGGEERPRGRRGGRGRGRRDEAVPQTVGAEPPRERTGDGREPIPFVPAKPLEELSATERATLDEAKAVLEELLRLMELSGSVEVVAGAETTRLNVRGEDLGILIGRRGEKLASLQHIVNLIVARREGQHHRIAVDVENYRGRREDQLREVADRAAKRVSQTGKIIQLEAMPAMERRIVHIALRDHPSVRTQSVGVEPNRRIVVLPAEKTES